MPLFKSKEEKELERRIKAKQGRTRVLRHVGKQRQSLLKYWELGKQALALGDERQFKIIGQQYMWTEREVKRWERYVLMLDTIEARANQAAAITEFVGSIKALTDSIMAQASPQQVARLHQELEMALARAGTIQERLEILMEATDDAMAQSEGEFAYERAGDLETLKSEMAGELTGGDADARIADGLKQLEAAMRKEMP